MNLRLEGTFWTAECLGHFCVRQAIHVAQNDRRALGGRQAGEKPSPGGLRVATAQWVGRWFCARLEDELDRLNTVDPDSVATDVQDDGREPRSQAKRADALPVVGDKRAIRADERILGGLFGITAVAENSQGDREEPAAVGFDERLERSVQIGGELRRERSIR